MLLPCTQAPTLNAKLAAATRTSRPWCRGIHEHTRERCPRVVGSRGVGSSSDRESDDVPRALVVRGSSVRSVASFVGGCQYFYERRQRRSSSGWFEKDVEERAHGAGARSATYAPIVCRNAPITAGLVGVEREEMDWKSDDVCG